MLNGQPGVIVTHEGASRCGETDFPRAQELSGALRGHLPWTPDVELLGTRLAAFEEANTNIVGDVAFYYLPYVEAIMERSRLPVSFVCLKRDRKNTVESFLEHTLHRNHWIEHDGSHWKRDDIWDPCFPKYELSDKLECLDRYWNDYYEAAAKLERVHGNFRVFDTESLNDPVGVQEILDFLEVGRPGERDMTSIGYHNPRITKPRQRLVYVLNEDTRDVSWSRRFSLGIENLLKQPRIEEFEICVADCSRESIAGDLKPDIQRHLRIEHIPSVEPINRSFAINLAYRRLCADQCDCFFLLDTEDVLFPGTFFATCLDTYISTDRNICMSGVGLFSATPGKTDPENRENVEDVSVRPGGGMLIKCSLFEEAGGFDEALETRDAGLEDFIDRMIQRDVFFVDRNLVLYGRDAGKPEGPAVEEDRRRLERKRKQEIPGRDWLEWGNPDLRCRIRNDIVRHMTPIRNDRFTLDTDRNGELVLHDGKNALRINETAAALYGLCDGERTVGGIVDLIQQQTGEWQERLQVDVREGLAQLKEAKTIRLS